MQVYSRQQRTLNTFFLDFDASLKKWVLKVVSSCVGAFNLGCGVCAVCRNSWSARCRVCRVYFDPLGAFHPLPDVGFLLWLICGGTCWRLCWFVSRLLSCSPCSATSLYQSTRVTESSRSASQLPSKSSIEVSAAVFAQFLLAAATTSSAVGREGDWD